MDDIFEELKRIHAAAIGQSKTPTVDRDKKTSEMLAEAACRSGDNVLADMYFEEAVKESPNNIYLKNNYAYNLLRIGEPARAKEVLETLIRPYFEKGATIGDSIMALSNYMMACDYLGVPSSERLQIGKLFPKYPRPEYNKKDKIRLCYISHDAHNHAVGRALIQIVRAHDLDRFEIVFLYSNNIFDNIMKDILRIAPKSFWIGTFGEENAMRARDVHDLIVKLDCDILIDTNGHTNGGARFGSLLSHRPCPYNVEMLGYPNELMVPYYDVQCSGHTAFAKDTFQYQNTFGYMPIFKTLDVQRKESFWQAPDVLRLGVISNPSKIQPHDVTWYDSIMSKYPKTTLTYSRLGREYTKSKADSILAIHSPHNRPRVKVIETHFDSYAKTFEQFDAVLDTTNWNLHATMLDSLSAGVPVICGEDRGTCASRLSRDIYRTLPTNLLRGAVITEDILASPESLKVAARSLYNIMGEFNNVGQWTHALEDDLFASLIY